MKYAEVWADEFIDCFYYNKPCDREEMLKKMYWIISEILIEDMVYRMWEDDPEKIERHKDLTGKLENAIKRWNGSLEMGTHIKEIREKYNGYIYEADLETLTADEIFSLTAYPFCGRMGGGYENDFAECGSLGRHLVALKKKDIEEDV